MIRSNEGHRAQRGYRSISTLADRLRGAAVVTLLGFGDVSLVMDYFDVNFNKHVKNQVCLRCEPPAVADSDIHNKAGESSANKTPTHALRRL